MLALVSLGLTVRTTSDEAEKRLEQAQVQLSNAEARALSEARKELNRMKVQRTRAVVRCVVAVPVSQCARTVCSRNFQTCCSSGQVERGLFR